MAGVARRLPHCGPFSTAAMGAPPARSAGKTGQTRSSRSDATAECCAWLTRQAPAPPRNQESPTPIQAKTSRFGIAGAGVDAPPPEPAEQPARRCRQTRRRAKASRRSASGGPPAWPYCQVLRRGAVAPAAIRCWKPSEGRRRLPRLRSRRGRRHGRSRECTPNRDLSSRSPRARQRPPRESRESRTWPFAGTRGTCAPRARPAGRASPAARP